MTKSPEPAKTEKQESIEIVKITEAENWVVDNIYLLSGYRKNFNNVRKAFNSILIKHNELMNIWTHLIGAIIFIFIFFHLAASNNFKKFETTSFEIKLKKMLSSSKNFIQGFKDDLDPFLTNMGSVIDSMNTESLNSFLDKSKDKLNDLKNEYQKRLLEFKDQMEQHELNMIIKVEEHLDVYLDKVDGLQSKIKNKFNQLVSSENNDSNDKSILTNTIDTLLHTFDSFIPEEGTINGLFSNFSNYLTITPFFVYLSSAIFCLLASAIYHWFYTISYSVHKFLHKFDLAGISILVFGSSFAMFYYCFYCNPFLRTFYNSLSFIFCFTVFIVSLFDKMHTIEFIKWKSLMYGGLGLSNIIPYIHIVYYAAISSPENEYLPFDASYFWLLVMACLYLGGLTIYTLRIPERFFPKTFDIWLNSHTIWHICVFLAALVHLKAIVIVYNSRLQKPCFLD